MRVRSADRLWPALAIATALLILAPLCVTEIPPVLDYPNHLARLYILWRGSADAFLSAVYAPHWAIVPNIGIDLIGRPLVALLPLYVAGKVLLALALVVPVAGTVAYSRAVCGVRSPWPLASAMIAYNATFLLGFMNFQTGIGAALFAAAAWARWRAEHPRRAVAIVATASCGIFFLHLFGVLFALLLIGSHELVRLAPVRHDRRALARAAATSAAAIALVAAGPILLLLASPFSGAHGPVKWTLTAFALRWMLAPFLSYVFWFDGLTALAVLGFIYVCRRLGRAVIAPEAWIAIAILMALYPFTPSNFQGGAFIPIRLPIMAGFLVFGGFVPRGFSGRAGLRIAAGVVALVVVRIAIVAITWSGQAADIADLRRVIARVPPGSVVLLTAGARTDEADYLFAMPHRRLTAAMTLGYSHLAALLITERDSIYPLVFSEPSQQPMTVRPAYRDVTIPLGNTPRTKWLRDDTPSAEQLEIAPYLDRWQDKFDDVLVLGADGIPDLRELRPDRLELVEQTPFAALLRVIRPHEPAAK